MDERTAAWAQALVKGVIARQQQDGRWENPVPTMRENDPTVATAMAVSALAEARIVLSAAE